MNPSNLRDAYLKSALRRLGYTYDHAISVRPIRLCLEMRAKAAERRTQVLGEPIQKGLL